MTDIFGCEDWWSEFRIFDFDTNWSIFLYFREINVWKISVSALLCFATQMFMIVKLREVLLIIKFS